jgi:hypothetical protein
LHIDDDGDSSLLARVCEFEGFTRRVDLLVVEKPRREWGQKAMERTLYEFRPEKRARLTLLDDGERCDAIDERPVEVITGEHYEHLGGGAREVLQGAGFGYANGGGAVRVASPPWHEDDKDGHYMFELGENITSRYKIISKMGEGVCTQHASLICISVYACFGRLSLSCQYHQLFKKSNCSLDLWKSTTVGLGSMDHMICFNSSGGK